MRIGGQIVLRLVLLGITLGKARQVTASTEQPTCNTKEYLSDEFNKCCSRCEPGYYAVKECTNTSDTQCRPCRAGKYTSDWNYADRCRNCQPCERHLVLKEKCSPTKDYVCACQDGHTCVQENAKGTRCEFCEEIKLPTTIPTRTKPPVTRVVQDYPPWITATLVISILLLAVFLGVLLHCCKKIIVKKCAYILKKPQMESTVHGAGGPPHEESKSIKIAIAEEGADLRYPTEETDASQSAVLLPNSFSPLPNGTTQ